MQPPPADLRRELEAVRAFDAPSTPRPPLPGVPRLVVERIVLILIAWEVTFAAGYGVWKVFLSR